MAAPKRKAGKKVTKRKVQRRAPAGTITGPCMEKGWQTPPELLLPVRDYFGGRIPFDAASTDKNPTGAVKFLTENSLSIKWPKRVFVNPPYGDETSGFMGKIAWESILGKEIIALLPCSRWEQAYWQESILRANAVCWIRKRVSFLNPVTGDRVSGNPYANMFLGYNVDLVRWVSAFAMTGSCQSLGPLSGSPKES